MVKARSNPTPVRAPIGNRSLGQPTSVLDRVQVVLHPLVKMALAAQPSLW